MNIYLRFFFWILFMFFLFFGVFFYDVIAMNGFLYIDELCTLFLVFLYIVNVIQRKYIGKEFLCFWGIFLFYLFYSLLFGQNIWNAVWVDWFIWLKPFLIFYCVYYLNYEFTFRQKKKIRIWCIILSLIAFSCIIYDKGLLYSFFGHPSRFATSLTIFSLLYLYCSDRSPKSIWIAFFILSIGLLSGRSKFFGFYVLFIGLFFLLKKDFKKIFSFKIICSGLFIAGLVLFVIWEKLHYYFIVGGLQNEAEMFARPALYAGLVKILEYFPLFGSGLGSYATFASGLFYSPMYEFLGISDYFGLTPEKPSFVSDTFFPSLAEIGIVGIILFFRFWFLCYRRAKRKWCINGNFIVFKCILLIFAFFFIECIADSTLTQNRGGFMMCLLALYLKDTTVAKRIN